MFETIIKAAGNLLGGAASKPDVDYTGMKEGITWRVKDAERAGIHPLAALGSSTGAGPVVLSNAGRGQGIANAAKNIGDYKLNQMQNKMAIEAHAQDLENKTAEADFTKMRTANEYLNLLTTQQNIGQGRPAFVKVRDNRPGKSGWKWVLDPEIAEALDSNAAIAASVYGNIDTGPKKPKALPRASRKKYRRPGSVSPGMLLKKRTRRSNR